MRPANTYAKDKNALVIDISISLLEVVLLFNFCALQAYNCRAFVTTSMYINMFRTITCLIVRHCLGSFYVI